MPPTAHSLHLENHRALVELYGESFTTGAVTFPGLASDAEVSDQPYETEAPQHGQILLVETELLQNYKPVRNHILTDESGQKWRIAETPRKHRNWPITEIVLIPAS